MRIQLGQILAFGSITAIIAACSVSAAIDVPNLSLSAGASCSNSDPDAGSDAGGCGTNLLCVNSYCVGTGALRFSMLFNVDSDFDIHVKTPEGDEISFRNRTEDNGTLDVDQCVRSCNVGQHVENVVFSSSPTRGTYQIWAVNYEGRRTGTFEIDAVADGKTQSFTGTLPAQDGAMSEVFTYVYPPPSVPDAGSDASTTTDGSAADSDAAMGDDSSTSADAAPE